MELFVYLLTDYIHFAKLIVLCNMFFVLPKRKVKHNGLLYLFVALVIAATSVFIFFYDNDFIEILLYTLVIFGMACTLYREKLFNVVVATTGMVFAASMIDEMTTILVDVLMELFKINGAAISNLVASILSLVLIYVVGIIYRKNGAPLLKNIGATNIIGFIILLAIDVMVVTIISIMNTELEVLRYKNLYLLALVFVIIGIFIQLASVILLFTQRNVYKEKEELTYKYLNEQKDHYEYLENREKETRKFRHDLRSHMEMISGLAKEQQYDRMNAYLAQMDIRIEDFGNVVTVQNGIVDAIINQYYARAQECGVTMEVKGRFPVDCTIDDFDLCTIFSNVLSNALEAARDTADKYISVECVYTEMVIMIIVSNSYRPDTIKAGQLRTRKLDLDYHGYGLENIKDSVKKYKGDLDIETKENMFILRILFQNMEKEMDENSNCG